MRAYHFAVFALGAGVAASIAFGTISSNPDYGRAILTIWPCLALGVLSVAVALVRGIGETDRSWFPYWVAGFVAYLVHLFFGFGLIYGASISATFAGQGLVAAAGNFGLFALWGLSLGFEVMGRGSKQLHFAALSLFAASTLGSTLLADRVATQIGGGAIICLWFAAIYVRVGKKRQSATPSIP